jgi:signal transduction histidine kinase
VVHAEIPVAGFVSVLLLTVILQHGLSLQRAMLESIQLRLRNDALAQKLQIEQRKAQEAMREQDLLRERQRMTQDLHDGLGSTLVSTLMAPEAGRLPHDAVPKILRDCVDDLRIVIDSMEVEDHDLTVVLATIRHRLGSRLQAAGLNLQWEIDDLPTLPWLGPSQTLQLMRIVQEALVNALKHARASTVRLSTRSVSSALASGPGPRVLILVQDDGVGFDRALKVEGRGLKNMSLRAQQLRADLQIESSPGSGTRLTLLLPVE